MLGFGSRLTTIGSASTVVVHPASSSSAAASPGALSSISDPRQTGSCIGPMDVATWLRSLLGKIDRRLGSFPNRVNISLTQMRILISRLSDVMNRADLAKSSLGRIIQS